jgi:hypothetical protein
MSAARSVGTQSAQVLQPGPLYLFNIILVVNIFTFVTVGPRLHLRDLPQTIVLSTIPTQIVWLTGSLDFPQKHQYTIPDSCPKWCYR